MLKHKRKICVVTGCRADYGLLYWLLKEIKADPDLELQIVVSGAHLVPGFGLTYKNIIHDGFKINAKVDLKLGLRFTARDIARSEGLGVIGFTQALDKLKPDMIVILGDRFEMLSAASASLFLGIPIAHIHGGEITEGAYDDYIRNAITKMAYLHFVCHREYRRRVIQMGEEPARVFNFGAPGLDNLKKISLLSCRELERQLDFKIGDNTALVTFHPETRNQGSVLRSIKNLLSALKSSGLKVIFTLPNVDVDSDIIIREINKFVALNPQRYKAFKSLGQLKYFSLMQYCHVMVGNSSSGILEASSFKLAVVNIGERQKGRIRTGNIIDCGNGLNSIESAIRRALSPGFKEKIKKIKNPYAGKGFASVKIKDRLKKIDLKRANTKHFMDIRLKMDN